MKEIYVYKTFYGWKGISKEEAEEKIKEGRVFGEEMKIDRGRDLLKITLLRDDRFGLFRASEEAMNQLTHM